MKLSKHHVFTLPALLAGAIVFLTASIFASLTRAQSTPAGQTLEVSPPSQELSVTPGQTIDVKAKIRNRTDATVTVAVRLEDFIAAGSEGQVALTEKGPYAVSSWTTLSTNKLTLKPNQTEEVTATVRVPSESAGGRYGSFVFTISGSGEPGRAVLTQEIASLFLLDIAGVKEENLTITAFTAPKFLEFGPVPFTITYKNSGNAHLKPAGLVAITDMFGRKVADVVQIGTNVFPGNVRQVQTSWENKLLLGKYSAQAIMVTGGSKNETLTATTTFVVFPVRIAAVVLLVLVFLFLMRHRLFRATRVLMGK